MPRLLTLVVLLSAALPTARAFCQPSSDVTYGTLIERGLSEFNASHWSEARELFRQAHAIEPGARTLRAIGYTSFELADYPEAVRSLTLALAETRRALSPQQHTEAVALLARAEPQVARIELTLVPANATVLVDGQPGCMLERTLLLSAGAHELAFSAEGYEAERRTVTAHVATASALRVELHAVARAPEPVAAAATAPTAIEPAPHARDRSWRAPVGWSLVGLAGASGVVSLVTGIRGKAIYDDLAASCPDHVCPQSSAGDIHHGRALVATSTATTVVSLAAGATGALLLLLDRRARRHEETPRVQVTGGPGHFGLGMKGTF